MSQKGFSALILLGCGLILCIVISVSYYITQVSITEYPTFSMDQKNPSNNDPSTLALASVSPSPSLVPSLLFLEPKKRFYIPGEKLMTNVPMPNEIANVNENDLYELKCAPTIFHNRQNNSYGYYEKSSDKPTELKDEFLLNLLEKVNAKNGLVSLYRACLVEDGRVIVEFEKPIEDLNAEVGFGVLDDGNFQEIAKFQTVGESYFACSQSLQFTKENILWYLCGDGDGAYSSISFYKVDFNNRTSSRLTKCESSADLDNMGIPYRCL